MFTNKFTISVVVASVFAIVAFMPVVATDLSLDTAVTAAWGGGGSDGSGGEGGDYGGNGCGGCGSSPFNPTPTPEPESEPEVYDCTDSESPDYNPLATVDDGSCTYPTPAPVCDYFTANGQSGTITIAENTPLTLAWGTTNATQATLSHGIGEVDPDGERTFNKVNPPSQTFILWIKNDAGDGANCKVTVNVEPVEEKTPICNSFNVLQTEVSKNQNIRLQWNTTDVTSASVNQGVGPVVVSDETVVVKAPAEVGTYTYIFTFDGETNATCRDTLTVVDTSVTDCKDPTATNYNPDADIADNSLCTYTSTPVCNSFNIRQTQVVPGANIAIDWETTNVTNTSISRVGGGSVNVNVDGPRNFTVPTAVGTYTYALTYDGETDTLCRDTIVVAVDSEPEIISCEDNVTFTASDTSLGSNGGDVVLTWSTTGLDSLSINGVASEALSDSEEVRVNADATYTLTGIADGETIRCPLKIDVATGGGGGGGGSSNPSPRCDLDISDTRIARGESVTLEWRTWNTDEIILEDDDGNILIESDDRDDLDSEITIQPTKDTTFTLNAIDGRKDRECEVEVEVGGGVSLSQVREQFPTVAGISLTQVPYTGFEAGPMMTFIFYALLAVWGLFVAYVVAVRKNVISGVSFAGSTPAPAPEVLSVEVAEPANNSAYTAAATTTEAPSNLPTMAAPVVGYAAMDTATPEAATAIPEMSEAELDAAMQMTELENRAHMQNALFSSDAMRFFTNNTPEAEQLTALDAVIKKAKGAFPTEDGWVVINLARLESLVDAPNTDVNPVTTTEATTGGSLAEAIVTGNVVAAYQMIASRPMIALADAATELDGVIRKRAGDTISNSTLLTEESKNLSDEQLRAAIHALTSALDGVYTSEEDAVKMAIMKAVKAVA